jgi:mono/diheme cytochrome c family protein
MEIVPMTVALNVPRFSLGMALCALLIGCSGPQPAPTAPAAEPVVQAPAAQPSLPPELPPNVVLGSDADDMPAPGADAAAPVSLKAQIVPLLKQHCASCHSPRGAGAAADLYFDAKGQPLEKEISNSAFAILESIEHGQMPPNEPDALTEEQVEQLRTWVFSGAPQN